MSQNKLRTEAFRYVPTNPISGINKNNCMAAVSNGRSCTFRQCSRKKVYGEWCVQHHPDAIEKRKKESEARYRIKNQNGPFHKMQVLRSRLQQAERLLQQAVDQEDAWFDDVRKFLVKDCKEL